MTNILDFVSQPDSNTCQAAAIARVLGANDVMTVRRQLLDISNRRGSMAGDPYVMADFLKGRVEDYAFIVDASIEDVKEALGQGYHLITHGYFTRSGHVIGISPFADGAPFKADPRTGSHVFNAEDPWAEFDFPRWRYTARNGNNCRYSSYGIYAACVASANMSHAARLYRRRALDTTQRNMWLHLVKN